MAIAPNKQENKPPQSTGKEEALAPKNGTSHIDMDETPLLRADNLILVMNTPKGRGVFAKRAIPARTILEVAPVLVLDPIENNEHVSKTDLYNYTYNWPYIPPTSSNGADPALPTITTTQAVVFGLGSMFNHSTMHQNVGWERDIKHLLIRYTSLRDIAAGEELCISYGDRLTFIDVDRERIEKERDPDDWTDVMNIINLID